METINLKKHFFEMVSEEPLLQLSIAKRFSSSPDFIKALALEENEFLALPGVRELITKSYNQCMPEYLRINSIQTLNSVNTPRFDKSFSLTKTSE